MIRKESTNNVKNINNSNKRRKTATPVVLRTPKKACKINKEFDIEIEMHNGNEDDDDESNENEDNENEDHESNEDNGTGNKDNEIEDNEVEGNEVEGNEDEGNEDESNEDDEVDNHINRLLRDKMKIVIINTNMFNIIITFMFFYFFKEYQIDSRQLT